MRTGSITILLGFLAMLAAWSLAPLALAQQEQVGVRLEAPQKMYVGDTADLQIVVTGSKNVEAPDLSTIRDFDIKYRGPQDMSSQMTTIFNGRMQTKVTVTFVHLYAITPRFAGQLEIPAVPIIVDGKPYLTNPARVEVVEPRQGEGFKLELISDHAKAFVGEPITVRMVWTIPPASQLGNVQFALPIEGTAHEIMPGPVTRSLNQGDGRSVVVPLNNVQVLALNDQHAVVIDRTIIPSEPGDIIIGPARTDYLLVVGQQRPTINDMMLFGNRPITDRQFSIAPSLTIHVEPLPASGKPANFSGLVGTYSISATSDANNVSVGDPINLTLVVNGPYPPSIVPALELTKQPSLKSHFRVPREPILPQTGSGAAVFQAMIRARGPDVTQIPPVSLNFFDPQTRQYRTVQTGAIPLTVRSSNTVSLPDEPEANAAPPPTPERRPGGLPDISREAAGSGAPMLDPNRELRRSATLALLVVPPAMCVLAGGTLGLVRWRQRDPAALRRAGAIRTLKRSLRKATRLPAPIDAAANALSNFAADWFDHSRDTLTAPQAGALLSSTGTRAGQSLAGMLGACDLARFGAGLSASEPLDPKTLPDRALALARDFAAEASRSAQEVAA